MTIPTASTTTLSGKEYIDALLSDTKWGVEPGTSISLTYSFPWSGGANAVFAGYSTEDYSLLGEPQASSRYGFSATEQQVFRDALAQWSSVANITFTEVTDTAIGYGTLRAAWTSADLDAWGWSYLPNAYWPSGGDIWISTNTDTGAINWDKGHYDWSSIVHEIGHALGFKHPFEEGVTLEGAYDSNLYTVMSYTDAPKNVYPSAGMVNGVYDWIWYYVYPETPMLYDIAAIQYLYGANTNYRTGNDVYTFDVDRPFFQTIWDAGGIDEISVSNFTLGCEIDLREGAFSSIRIAPPSDLGGARLTYDGSDNLAIAFDCEIENASGGAGDDRLIGNGLDNRLNGGAGTDTAVFTGRLSDYTITHLYAQTWSIEDKRNVDGKDTVVDIEQWEFLDQVAAAQNYVSDSPLYQITSVLSELDAPYALYTIANDAVSIAVSTNRAGQTVAGSMLDLVKTNGKPYVPKLQNITVLDKEDGSFALLGQKGSRWVEINVASDGKVAGSQQVVSLAGVLAREITYGIDLNNDAFIGGVITQVFDADGALGDMNWGLYRSSVGAMYIDVTNAQEGDALTAQAQPLTLASGRLFTLKTGQSVLGLAERFDGDLEFVYSKGTRLLAQQIDPDSGVFVGSTNKLAGSDILAREYYYDLDLNNDGIVSLVGQASPPDDWS